MKRKPSKKETDEFCFRLLAWYDGHARPLPWRTYATPYRVMVSEFMLQQTRVEAVVRYFERFVQELPDVPSLADAGDERLFKLWEGLGYYRRAQNLRRAAAEIVRLHNGRVPENAEALRALPGFGDYTAGAVASIAFGLRTPAVDGNVLRVATRLTAHHGNIDDTRTKREITEFIRHILPQSRVGDFNQALMELGATVCLPGVRPGCGMCPVSEHCDAKKRGLASVLPVKSAKAARKVLRMTVFIICADGSYALRLRPPEGLLGGLWEFPVVPGELTRTECADTLRGMGVEIEKITPLSDARHIFSHVEWHMKLVYAETEKACGGELVWANAAEIGERYAVPSAFRACKDYVRRMADDDVRDRTGSIQEIP